MANERPTVPDADNAPGADKPAATDNVRKPVPAADSDKAAGADNPAGADNFSTPAGSGKASRAESPSHTNKTPAGPGASGAGKAARTLKPGETDKPVAEETNAGKGGNAAEGPGVPRSHRRSNRAGVSRLGNAASSGTETAAGSVSNGSADISVRSEEVRSAATGRSDIRERSGSSDRRGTRTHSAAGARKVTPDSDASDRSHSSGHSGSAGRSDTAGTGSSRRAGGSGRSDAAGSGSPRRAGGSVRSDAPGRPDRSVRNTKTLNTLSHWTWRDYALQLSVVVIGIVVTFAGSGVIERWRVAREVRATMQLVHAELETNRADFMQVWDYQQWEIAACKQLTDNRRDLKRIPPDTMASFDPVYGRIHFFHPRRDAFEVLKNSGLMSSVPDKDFLLSVTQGYAALANLEENISMYFQMKLTAQNDMTKAFSEKQRECFYTGSMYERWECIFSVPCFAEFLLTAPYYFPEGYIERLLAHVDRAAQAIETKYRSIKKTTDD